MFPEGLRRVFWKAVDAQAEFDVDTQGRATNMTFRRVGRDIKGPGVEAAPL